MIPLIIGGVTLAAVGYAVKEYCEEEGCPWDTSDNIFASTQNSDTDADTNKNSDEAKKFHKLKKEICKSSMQKYKEFLETYKLTNSDIDFESKPTKQKFSDDDIDDELLGYIAQISDTLEILSHNLSLEISKAQHSQKIDESKEQIDSYAQSISALANLELFQGHRINKLEILSTLVKAMGLTTQKNSLHVELDVA